MILPTNLALIAGRGSAKTSEIQVERLIAMMYDMPGAPAAWVADTFTNLQANVLPTVLEGLERKGYRENTHFIIEKQPPEYSDKECEDLPRWLRPHFWKPFNKIVSYKRTIVFFTGFNLTFGSLDRPASLAGRSYVHVFGDEAKYFPEEKIANLLKAVRGYRVQFGRSPFYRGRTFTTDMPNASNVGEYDWIFKDLKNMDKETVLTLYKTALVVNEATQEYIAAKERFMQTRTDEDRKEYRNKLRTLNRWYADWYELRKHPKARTVFLLASSYVNVDILSLEYLEDAMSTQLADVNAPDSKQECASTPTSENGISSTTGTSCRYKTHSDCGIGKIAASSVISIPSAPSTWEWISGICSRWSWHRTTDTSSDASKPSTYSRRRSCGNWRMISSPISHNTKRKP